jgi:hypothetical protein
MKYNCIVIVCILTVLLNSCSNTQLINGTYIGKHCPHVFIFSADSTFKYEYRAMWYSESSGTWRKEGNFIYLNSSNQIDKIPIEYTKVTSNQDSVVIVNIGVNSQNKPPKDYICWPFVNGNFVYFDPERGSYSFKSEFFVDSLYFKVNKSPFVFRGTGYKMGYDDVKTETIYPHLSIGENIDVTINIIDSLFGYKVFDNTKLKVKRNKIIFKDGGKINKLSLKK